MVRLLFWLFVILAIQWLWRQSIRRDDAARRPGAQQDSTQPSYTQHQRYVDGAATNVLSEAMVRCAQCGVHVPVSETVMVNGKRFCCSKHAARYGARPAGCDDAR